MRTPRAVEIVRERQGELVDHETGQVIPRWPCRCGGKYTLGYSDTSGAAAPMLVHTLPYCDRYRAVEDPDQAVRFSKENREALAS